MSGTNRILGLGGLVAVALSNPTADVDTAGRESTIPPSGLDDNDVTIPGMPGLLEFEGISVVEVDRAPIKAREAAIQKRFDACMAEIAPIDEAAQAKRLAGFAECKKLPFKKARAQCDEKSSNKFFAEEGVYVQGFIPCVDEYNGWGKSDR